MLPKKLFLLLLMSVLVKLSMGQPCSLPGMTPGSAIPVCGTSVFHQVMVTNSESANPCFFYMVVVGGNKFNNYINSLHTKHYFH